MFDAYFLYFKPCYCITSLPYFDQNDLSASRDSEYPLTSVVLEQTNSCRVYLSTMPIVPKYTNKYIKKKKPSKLAPVADASKSIIIIHSMTGSSLKAH